MVHPNISLEKKLFLQGYRNVGGLDEAGRGALAGPLVAAVVVLDQQKIIQLREAGLKIRESKLLSASQRERLFEEVKDRLIWSVGIVSHREIDQIGISRANVLVFRRSLASVKRQPDFLLLDFVHGFSHAIDFKTIVDGDYKVFSIALASVIAKVTRDRLMKGYHEKYPEYGFEKHKGYGTRQHQQTLRKYGPCPIHRRSFKFHQPAWTA